VKVPTLFITYSVDWSGNTAVSTKPRGSYVGISFSFEASFALPADGKPIKLKADSVKQPAIGLLKEEDLSPGPAEEKVYDTMATEAMESFGNKVMNLFFAKEK